MDRIEKAVEIINALNIRKLLDVGCRDCVLKKYLRRDIEYAGADMKQNPDNCVKYLGDIALLEVNERFDCVVALDFLEHIDDLHGTIDKLFGLTDKYLLVSLPNGYELKCKYMFLFKNRIGSKYAFGTTNSLDRHRWIMNYNEIVNFYRHKAREFGCDLEVIDIRYGAFRLKASSILGLALRALFPAKLTTSSVIAFFKKA